MDIRTKIDYIEQAVRSVSQHDDEDAGVRIAALDRVVAFCENEKTIIDAGVQARIATEILG